MSVCPSRLLFDNLVINYSRLAVSMSSPPFPLTLWIETSAWSRIRLSTLFPPLFVIITFVLICFYLIPLLYSYFWS